LTTITLSIPGEPITKKRPRFARVKGGVRTYDSQSEAAETMKWQMKARIKGQPPLQGALHLSLIYVFARPKSRVKLKEVFHTLTPDLDNLIKFSSDVGNDTLWYDDRQIVSISAIKIYGSHAQTIITVGQVES
tara:strand:- start:316 stop:714 length:399 start_codon:yes stop_codon:yes gene_type:complete